MPVIQRQSPQEVALLGRRCHKGIRGISLIEVMFSALIFIIVVLGMMSAFTATGKNAHKTKRQNTSTALIQDKIQALRSRPYHSVPVTLAPQAPDPNFPSMYYETSGVNAPETVRMGGQTFERRVFVERVQEQNGAIVPLPSGSPDEGLKQVTVYAVWQTNGNWRKAQMSTLLEGPRSVTRDAKISGVVTVFGSGATLSNARVAPLENMYWSAVTDAFGRYEISVASGSYNLRATRNGFLPDVRLVTVAKGQTSTGNNIALKQTETGSIQGQVIGAGNEGGAGQILISEVLGGMSNTDVGGTSLSGEYMEYVELYNASTMTITFTPTLETLSSQQTCSLFTNTSGIPQTVTITMAPNTYWMLGSTQYDVWASSQGRPRPAYTTGATCNIQATRAQAIRLSYTFNGQTYTDAIGWGNGSKGPLAGTYEGTFLTVTSNNFGGIGSNCSVERKSTGTATEVSMRTDASGNSWDTNDNAADWVWHVDWNQGQSGGVESPGGGTGGPKAGALVFANDGASGATVTDSNGNFLLTGVATGSWTVFASSGNAAGSAGPVLVETGLTAVAPAITLSGSATLGYIRGYVRTQAGVDVQGVTVESLGAKSVTDANGAYFLACPAGNLTVTVNPGSADPQYIEVSTPSVPVTVGQMTSNVNFTLKALGGEVVGRVMTDGGDPLPGVPVVVQQGGVDKGSAVSAADGSYAIYGLPTGVYDISLELDGTQSTGAKPPVTVTANNPSTVNFSVTSAMGVLTGALRWGGTGGPLLTEGVIVFATTGTLSGTTPPVLNAARRLSPPSLYGGTGKDDGSYKIEVRGDATYNVYAWYTDENKRTYFKAVTQRAVASGLSNPTTADIIFP